MTRFARRIAIVGALGIAAFLAIFFGVVNRSPDACGRGCGPPPPRAVIAKVSIPKGTSAAAILTEIRYTDVWVEGSMSSLSGLRGEVAIRTIPAGTRLTLSDFRLRSPMYYPRGYPKSVSASEIPPEMTYQLPARSYPTDFEIAPGVWVDGAASQATLDEHVANGTLIGYCRAVRAFRAHNPGIPFGWICWRKDGTRGQSF
jgi:hypothetical protein